MNENPQHDPFDGLPAPGIIRTKRAGQKVSVFDVETGEAAVLDCRNTAIAKRVFEKAKAMLGSARDVPSFARALAMWCAEGEKIEFRDHRVDKCPVCDEKVDTGRDVDGRTTVDALVCPSCESALTVERDGLITHDASAVAD